MTGAGPGWDQKAKKTIQLGTLETGDQLAPLFLRSLSMSISNRPESGGEAKFELGWVSCIYSHCSPM